MTLGNASGDDVTVTGSLASSVPIKTTRSYDIGSADLGLRSLYLGGNSTHTVALSAASAGLSGDVTFTLPTGNGTANYALLTDGSGVTSWGQIVNASVSASAAIDGSKIVSATGAVAGVVTASSQTFGGLKTFNNGASFLGSNSADTRTVDIDNSTGSVSSSTRMVQLAYSGVFTATNAHYITFTDGDSTNGSITAASGSTVAYNTSSDARLKTDVRDYTEGVKVVKSLRPRRFRWLKDGTESVGFIAQELRTVLPDLVTGDESLDDAKKNPLGVDYGKLTPYLAAAVKACLERIEKLEARAS